MTHVMDDVKVRPIKNGYIVSCYEVPKQTKVDQFPRGEMHEEFYVSEDDAAARMAELAKSMRKKNADSSSPSPE